MEDDAIQPLVLETCLHADPMQHSSIAMALPGAIACSYWVCQNVDTHQSYVQNAGYMSYELCQA